MRDFKSSLGSKEFGEQCCAGRDMLPKADCLREVIEFLLRRTDPVARRGQMLHLPCQTLWPVLSWDLQRWLDFIFLS